MGFVTDDLNYYANQSIKDKAYSCSKRSISDGNLVTMQYEKFCSEELNCVHNPHLSAVTIIWTKYDELN